MRILKESIIVAFAFVGVVVVPALLLVKKFSSFSQVMAHIAFQALL